MCVITELSIGAVVPFTGPTKGNNDKHTLNSLMVDLVICGGTT